MARNTNIKLRRSATAGAKPTTSNLDLGELALNTYDGKLYAKTTEGSASEIIQVGSATDSYHKIRKSQTITFTVTVASKTTDHTWHNSGSSSGYYINGLQSPHLHLVPGNKYRFDQSDSSNGGHPLRFYYDAAKNTQYTTGITTNGTAGSSGAYTEITVSDDTPMVLHYQCTAHGYMGGRADFGTRNLTGYTTDSITEGSSNLYYTDARVESYLDSNGTTFPDNIISQYGSSNDFSVYFTGSEARLQNTTGDIRILNNADDKDVLIESDNGSGGIATYAMADGSEGSFKLFHYGSKKLETSSTGVTVTNTLTADAFSVDTITIDNSEIDSSGDLTLDAATSIILDADSGYINLKDGGTSFGELRNSSTDFLIKSTVSDKDLLLKGNDGGSEITALRLDMSDAGTAIFNNHVNLSDSKFLRLGDDNDFIIYHDGTTNYIQTVKQDSDIIFRGNDGGTNFNALQLDMSDAGTAIFNHDIKLGDGGKAIFGAGSDLNIYHDGSDSRIQDTGTGNLLIDGQDRVNIRRTSNGNTMGSFIAGGAVELYYNAGKKFETTNTGIDVTGEVKGDSLDIDGNADISGNLILGGNLTVSGTTTTVNSNTVNIGDNIIVLNSDETGTPSQNAGIEVERGTATNKTFIWDESNDRWTLGSENLVASTFIGNLTGNVTGNVTGTVSSLSNFDTGDLSEGSNLYYTNARADARIAAASIGDLSNVDITTNAPSSGQILKWNGTNFVPSADLSGSAASNSFETISVSGQSNVVADSSTDTLTLVAGTGMAISTNASSDTITFTSTATGTVTEAFKNIAVSGQSNIVADAAADTLTFAAGSGISLTTNASTDTLTITSTATGSVTEAFKTIAVSGQSDVVADSATDTLTLVAGNNMTLTTNASGDSITFASSGSSGGSQSGVFTEYTFTASSNQTTFTGSDDNSATLSYNASAVQVFLNGVLQENGTDYTATNGTSVVLVNAASSGDILQVSAYTQVLGFGDSALSELTGDGSTTAFTIAANPNNENNTQVYIDGVYQEKATYSVSGTTLTFSSAPPNGTSIEVVIGSRNVSVDDVNGLTVAADLTLSGLSAQNSEATSLMINGSNVVGTRELGSNAFTSNLSAYDTDNLTEGSSNLYFTNARADARIAAATTDDLSEGSSNLYFTNARVDSRLASGSLATISTSGNVTVGGNLTVSGTTTTLNTATLDVEDKNITLNYGSGDTSSTADGAGITIQDAVNSSTDASILWDATNDEFDFSHNISAPGLLNGAANSFIYLAGGNASNAGSNILLYGQSHSSDANTTVFRASGTETMRIASSGNVGIGTSNPSQPLHVEGNVRIADAGSIQFGSSYYQTITGQSGSNDLLYRTFQDHVFKTGTGPSSNTDGTTRMVIDVNGKVGIGTASPGVSLDVGSLTDAIRVPNGTTGQRPTAALGQLRYNTTTSEFEGYADGAWGKIGGGGDSFGTIAVSGQSNVVAEQENDTLTLVGTNGITITTNASSDTVTIDGRTSYSPFTTDLFTTSNNSTTAFVLSKTPSSEDNLIVFLEGVYQNKNSYTLSGTTLTLDSAPASGSEVIVHIVGDVITGEALTRNNFTGNGSDTDFTLTLAPMNENNCYVYSDGVYQEKSEFSVSGTTLTFGSAPASGASLEVLIPKATTINTPSDDSINSIDMFDDTTIMGSTVTSTTMTTTSATTIATHAAATYRTIKYIVQLTQGTDYHSTEINLIHDGSTVYISEYGTLFDNAVLGTLSAAISSGNIILQLTPGSNSSLTARVVSTAIPV